VASATFIKPERVSRFQCLADSSIDRKSAAMFEEAFRAALLLTCTLERAEAAVLEGIESLCDLPGESILMETVKSALHQNATSEDQSGAALSHLPPELRRVGRLPRDMRQCFVLRILLGHDRKTCAQLQHVSPDESDLLLRIAVRRLASAQPARSSSFAAIYDC